MLFIPAGNAQVSFGFKLPNDAEPMWITFGVSFDGVIDWVDALTDLAVEFGTLFNTVVGFDYSLILAKAVIGGDGGPGDLVEVPITGVGFAGGDATPNNCAFLVKKRSGTPGRRNAGRFYIPGVPEPSVLANGVLNGASHIAAQNAATAWLTHLETLFTGMVILHPTDAPSTEPTAVQNLLVDTKIGTQRRRLR